MKYVLLVGIFFSNIHALEYAKKFENDKVSVAYVKIAPQEEIGLHYDKLPQLVIALAGGIITRLEADGSTTDVEFPTGKLVFRPAETSDKMHKSINSTSNAIELMVIEFK